MKLYEIADQYKALRELVDSGELTQDQIADTLEGMQGELVEKLTNCMRARAIMIADASAAMSESNRLKELADQANKKVESLDAYIKKNMIDVEQDKIDLGLWKLLLRKASKKLGAVDESKVDSKYFISVPASQKLNKKMLLADAKLGLVDVELVDSERGLTVK